MSTDGGAGVVLVGFDGSREASRAIAVGARVLPDLAARVVNVWAPPGADPALRERVTHHTGRLGDLGDLMLRECGIDAEHVAADGTALARAAGWSAEPLTRRSYGDPGAELALLAAELRPAAMVVGSRGLGGASALLGSVSDLAVHHSPVPVLVVPPLLSWERARAATGPVVIAQDGSEGAARAGAAAAALLPGRERIDVHVTASVDEEGGPPDAVSVRAHGWGPRATAEALGAEAAARKAGVIVVGSRGGSTLRQLVLGSTAMAVLHHAHRPVLVAPAPES
ncbi:universal stress protein [Actinomycetospora callitridis]|uniref:universal stress protein n=1 Tax=Actinomycetospora callitridis TaxID=913944 RepID=UPI002365169D|nr:universal stress protein [Actinomycetospora callitridis]MDD7916407.1 universal stress protein [Actinomycetospora callitridis]